LGAVLLALLPIPVTILGLLPAYRMHARFLVLYAPIACLLLLAYLFYVRDSLARQLFADLLNPLPQSDPYYRASAGESLGRVLRRLRTGLLAVLPALLLITSLYCITRYTARLGKSIDLATLTLSGTPIAERAASAAGGPQARRPSRPTTAARPADSLGALEKAPLRDTIAEYNTVGRREAVLRTAGIESIPMFTELTVLYIGIFAAAMTALVLMALKEYAKEAMGLSEQDLVLGGWSTADEVGQAPVVKPDPE
jgi:hypothetical protein